MDPEKELELEINEEEQFKNKVKNLIRNGKFDDRDVKNNKKFIASVVEDLPLNEQSIDFLQSLFQHYRLKVLITFRSFCEKIKSQNPGEEVMSKWKKLVEKIWVEKIISWPQAPMQCIKNFFSFFEFQKYNLPSKATKIENYDTYKKKQFVQFVVKVQQFYEAYLVRKSYTDFQTNFIKFSKFKKELNIEDHPFKRLCVQYIENIMFRIESDEEEEKECEEICCRVDFIDKEELGKETDIFEFKDYFFPFREGHLWKLKELICAFLNSKGGFLFLGIREEDGITKVKGYKNYGYYKDKLIASLTHFVLKSLVPQPFGLVSFDPIPIYDEKEGLTEKFVLRVKINPGSKNQLYYFIHKEHYYFSERINGQVLCYNFENWKEQFLLRREKQFEVQEKTAFHRNCRTPIYPDLEMQRGEKKMEKEQEKYILLLSIPWDILRYRKKNEKTTIEKLKAEFGGVEAIENNSFAMILKGEKEVERLYDFFNKERKGSVWKNSVIDIGSQKLQIWFHEDLVDLAEFYLKKELRLDKIHKVDVKKDEENTKYSENEKSCNFIFENKKDPYYCFKVFVAVDKFKRKMEKTPLIYEMPV